MPHKNGKKPTLLKRRQMKIDEMFNNVVLGVGMRGEKRTVRALRRTPAATNPTSTTPYPISAPGPSAMTMGVTGVVPVPARVLGAGLPTHEDNPGGTGPSGPPATAKKVAGVVPGPTRVLGSGLPPQEDHPGAGPSATARRVADLVPAQGAATTAPTPTHATRGGPRGIIAVRRSDRSWQSRQNR